MLAHHLPCCNLKRRCNDFNGFVGYLLRYSLRENFDLPCLKNTRQKLFGTRQSIRRVSAHGKGHTVKIGTAKDLCCVPFCPEHGEGFAVCLSTQNTAKNDLTVSQLTNGNTVFAECFEIHTAKLNLEIKKKSNVRRRRRRVAGA
jgi:hypothetical protein